MSFFFLVIKTLYFICISSFILYSLNTIFYIFIFALNQKKKAKKDKAIIEEMSKEYQSPKMKKKLPRVLIQLPVFNEKFVIERLIKNTLCMNYPKDKLEIQILDDSNDETKDIIAKLVNRYKQKFNIKHIRRKNRDNYKAGALKHGMSLSKAEYIAIFDADFVPPKNFLYSTLPFLLKDEKLGMVQTRWGHLNENNNAFTQAQAIGIDGHFVIEQSAKHFQKVFFNFNGTAGIWRRQAILDAGGWEGDTLTEDIDLSYRAQLVGWGHYYLCDTISPAELPDNVLDFKSQQRRWAKGSIQTAQKLLLKIWMSPYSLLIKIQSSLHLTHYTLQFFIFLLALLTIPLIHFDLIYRNAFLSVLLTISLLIPSCGYFFSQFVQKKKIKFYLYPYLMTIGIGMSINNGLAVISGLFNKETEFIRTPKKGEQSNQEKTMGNQFYSLYKKNYWLFVEIIMTIYCFAAFLISFSKVSDSKVVLFFSTFTLLMSLSYCTVSVLSIKQIISDQQFNF